MAVVGTRARAVRLMGGTSVAALMLGAGAAQAQTTPVADVAAGSTHTTVTPTGAGSVVVTTDNVDVAGKVALNRFASFKVATDTTATLVLPTGATSLVNVVAGDIRVDGTVTSRLASAGGAVGGNLFFLTSGGMFVGATGVINTGRLIVRGPAATGAALPDTDSFFGTSGTFRTGALLDYAPVGTVSIAGRINAPGGIDIRADTVTIGAGASLATGAAGVAAIRTVQAGADVSTAGLVEGAALVRVNGGIAIVGNDSIMIAGASGVTPGAALDARPTDLVPPTGDPIPLGGGITLLSSGAITVNGALTAWDGVSNASGPIDVKATRAAGFSADILNEALAPFTARSLVATSIDVGGRITGGDVHLTVAADATAMPGAIGADDVRQSLIVGVEALAGFGVTKLLTTLTGSGLAAFYSRAAADTALTIRAGARVEARRDLTIAATSTAYVRGIADIAADGTNKADAGGIALGIGVIQLRSDARVSVGGALVAGRDLSVSAGNLASSELKVRAVSTNDAISAAVAVSDVGVHATVDVAAGATIDGGTVSIQATNGQATAAAGFDNTALVIAKDGSAGGGAGSLLNLDIAATVNMAGTIGGLGATGNVSVGSSTVTNHLFNNASAATGSGVIADFKATNVAFSGVGVASVGKDALGLFAGKVKGFLSSLRSTDTGTGDGSGGDAGEEESGESTALRFGAAIGVVLNSQAATTAVTGQVASTGHLDVTSLVDDATLRNNVAAKTAATGKKDGEATSVAGAAAWQDSTYTSHATLGGTVSATGVAVNATTERPRGDIYDIGLEDPEGTGRLDDIKYFAGELMAKASPTLGIERGFFGSSAAATASTESAQQASLSGTISFASLAADTRAWVDPAAVLTLGGDLSVRARADLVLLNLGGPIPITLTGLNGSKGGSAGGIAIAYTGISPTTVAGIGRGVVVRHAAGTAAIGVAVDADATVQTMTLAPQAGQGNGITGAGTFALNTVLGATHATISNDARLDIGTGALRLNALSTLELWTVGGSLSYNKADGTGGSATAGSIGVAGAVNYVELDTRGLVGDAGDDDAAIAGSTAAAANAGVTAGTVSLDARTTGSVNALSVAGSVSSTKPAKSKSTSGETTQSPKGLGDKAKDKLNVASGLVKAPLANLRGDYLAYAQQYATEASDTAANAQNDAIAKGTPATNGFGVAGSASVNIATLTTHVETAGARFTRAAGTPATTAGFSARALEGVDFLAVTGGAAVTTGDKLESNTLIGGAYSLSYTGNATRAALSGTTIDGFDAVDVTAAANGTRVSAGLALAVDTTGTEKGVVVAGSVSHLIARDGASAGVTDSRVTGGGTGALSVLALDGLTLGAGAGGLSYSTSNAAGAGITIIDAQGPADGSAAADARLVRTPVTGFDSLSVRALTAAHVFALAAAGAVNANENDEGGALAASIAINVVKLGSTALIDVGDTGTGAVDVGTVSVLAGDLDPATSLSVVGDGRTAGTATSLILPKFSFEPGHFHPADLTGSTLIVSAAAPVAAAKGKAAGVGFGWNSVENSRIARITGGANGATTPTITARAVSVQSADHADIVSLGVGVGASTGGAGVMGSIASNLILGSSSASIARAPGAADNLVLNITGRPGATPNVAVGATSSGAIYGLAGAVAVGEKGAGGLAIGVNTIARNGLGDAVAGQHATLDGVSFTGTPDVGVTATAEGRIVTASVAGAVASENAAIAGAVTANVLAPTVSANASRLTYLVATPGDLRVRASDRSSILSSALVLAVAAEGGAGAIGLAINRVEADVSARLAATGAADRVLVRNLLVDAGSTASVGTLGLGFGGGESFGGAGSIAINMSDGDTDARIDLGDGSIDTAGSVGVLARRDTTFDVGAGVVAVSSQAAAGASLVVNQVGGGSGAAIVGDPAGHGTLRAMTGSPADAALAMGNVRTGEMQAVLPVYGSYDGFKALSLLGLTTPVTTAIHGVAVNASTGATMRTVAITGAASSGSFAAGVTAVVGAVTGSTQARILDADVAAGSGTTAQTGVTVDVRASSNIVGATFAGALAGASEVAAAAPVVGDGYAGSTTALVRGGRLASTGGIAVEAIARQAATELAVAGAVSEAVSATIAGVTPNFAWTTSATIDRPRALSALGSDGIAVDARSDATAIATFASLSVSGAVAAAGAVVAVTNQNATNATYTGLIDPATGLGAMTVAAPRVAITADGHYAATVAGGSFAGSVEGVSVVGNAVGVVDLGTIAARADGLSYADRAGAVAVRATGATSILPVIGQLSVSLDPFGGAASLGFIGVIAQNKIDATLSRPTIVARSVDVAATGYTQVDAVQLGAAFSGVALGANVTFIGIGAATDAGALFAPTSGGDDDKNATATAAGSDGAGGNRNLAELAHGGSTSVGGAAAQSGHQLSAGEKNTLADAQAASGSGSAFAQVAAPGDDAAARVRAQVTGTTGAGAATIDTGALTVASDANVLSRSTNAQVTGGLLVAAAGTVAVTRNAAQSIAYLGDVSALGGTLDVTATTGEKAAPGAPGTATGPTHAADAAIYAGTVGVGVGLGVGVADVTLATDARASSIATTDFNTARVTANDTASARSYVVGATLSSNAINVAVATTQRAGTVSATLTGTSLSDSLTVHATGNGASTAEAYGGAGGLMLSGNAAVATATDTRAVTAEIGENSTIRTPLVLVEAKAVPIVTARTYGITVGGLALGASVATATATGSVSALLGEGSTYDCVDLLGCLAGSVTVRAEAGEPDTGANVTANAGGSSGNGIVAINGAIATAINGWTTHAIAGADLDGRAGAALRLPVGALHVAAVRDLSTSSNADGVTLALALALGGQFAESRSYGETRATLANVDGSARGRLTGVTVESDALDRNTAVAVAGSGGLGGGQAAVARTDSAGTAITEIGAMAGKSLDASTLTATARSGADYRANSDSTLATLVGGSATTSANRVATTARVAVADGAKLTAGDFHLTATNLVGDAANVDGGYARGAGGGGITGQAAFVTNDITQNARVAIGDGASLRQYGGDLTQNGRATFIDARVSTNRSHRLALEIGGLMQSPLAVLDATYNADTSVDIGRNVLIRGDQGVGIGTVVSTAITDQAAAQVYGLTSIGGATSTSRSNVKQGIGVGDGTTIESMADIRLSAGTSADGVGSDLLRLAVQTDTFNWTVLPLGTEAGAHAIVNENNAVTVGDATIRSARDVLVEARGGLTQASAVGTGHNPYLEILRQTIGGGDVAGAQVGTVTLDGARLTGGYLVNRTITVTDGGIATNDAAFGSITDTDRLGQFTTGYGSFSTLTYLNTQIMALEGAVTAQGYTLHDPATDTTVTQQNATRAALSAAAALSPEARQLASLYDTRIALAQGAVASSNVVVIGGTLANGALTPNGTVFASGGVVTIGADRIAAGARGGDVTANGGGRITVTNTTGRSVLLGNLFVPMAPAGTISLTGAATALPGAITAHTPGGSDAAAGQISVTSGTGATSPRTDVILLGAIRNIGGNFAATAGNGNFVQFGTASVASFSASAPNGIFTVSMPGGIFSQGDPLAYFYGNYGLSLYTNQSGRKPSVDPEGAIERIATYIGAVASDTAGLPDAVATLENYYGGGAGTAGAQRDALNTLFLNFSHYLTVDGAPNGSTRNSIIFASCIDGPCKLISPNDQIANTDSFRITKIRLPFDNSGGQFGTDYYTVASYLQDLVVRGNPTPATVAPTAAYSTANAISATQVSITAQQVNLSGTIVAGPTKTRTLTIGGTLANIVDTTTGTVDLFRAAGGQAAVASGNIGAQFVHDAAGGYIKVDDVAAGAGGAITITGKILNTNPIGGELRVLNGFGNVSIVNNSGYELRVGTLNTGQSVSGTITLNDTAADGRTLLRTVYTNTIGGNVTMTQTLGGGAATTTTYADQQGVAGRAALGYQPTGQFYYVWDDSRNIVRDDVSPDGSLANTTLTPWRWADGGTAPQGGRFVDLSGTSADAVALRRALAGQTSGFVQIVSGAVTQQEGFGVTLNKGSIDFTLPLAATIDVKTGATATNQVGIVFDQGGSGGISINSSGTVRVTGALTGSSNGIGISGSNIVLDGGSITGSNVSLSSGGSLGTVADPFTVGLLGGQFSASSSEGNVSVALNSLANNGNGRFAPVYLGRVFTPGTATITTNTDLVSAYGQSTNIDAFRIVIDSAGSVVGGQFGGGGLAISLPDSGSVTVTAAGDVQLRQVERYTGNTVLPIGSITTPGDVTLTALGSIVAADATATVDQAKLDRFLDAARMLQLTPTGSGVVDPATLGALDNKMRADGYAAYDRLNSADPVEATAAQATLTALFGLVPASRGAIATLGITRTQQTAYAARNQGYAAWDQYALATLPVDQQRTQAATDALGRIEAIRTLAANPGLAVSADGADVTVTDWSSPALRPGGALYTLALATLRARVAADGSRETLALPTDADVGRGLQAYLDGLHAGVAMLVPGALPVLTATGQARIAQVAAAIDDAALTAWVAGRQQAAAAQLTQLFGAVPVSREAIATADIADLAGRATGATWSRSMLDVAVPSTAFVPVADTQFETRKPVITARGVTLIAGDSIGSFGPQRTYSFDANGFTGAAADRDLATAYLAAAGPGDLTTALTRDETTGRVILASFTTRRDQPLTITATGTVNAIAAATRDFSYYLRPTATDPASTIQGNIFLTDTVAMHVGTIASLKGTGTLRTVDTATYPEGEGPAAPMAITGGCNDGSLAAALCPSRVRLVAPDIIGVTTGAAPLVFIDTAHGTLAQTVIGNAVYEQDPYDSDLRNIVGYAGLIMGGQVRLEASRGSIEGADGGAIAIDTGSLEVLRAAGDIALVKRAPVAIPGVGFATTATTTGGTEETYYPCTFCGPRTRIAPITTTSETQVGAFAFGNDLTLGDVFAGGRLRLDNLQGSLLVARLASPLASENRNSRVVAGVLSLRAAGDIGSGSTDETGIVGLFDIQAPLIDRLIAGADPLTGLPGTTPAADGQPAGSVFFGLRGSTRIGNPDAPGASLLGARGDITIGTIDGFGSSISFYSDLKLGGLFNLTTDGDLNFANPDLVIAGLGAVYDPDTVDLSRLALTTTGRFSFVNTRNIVLGSLTTGGGTIESTQGSVTINGSLYGTGGPATPFAVKGRTGVHAGTAGLGSMAFASSNGDVVIDGDVYATDLTVAGVNVAIGGSLYGRSVALTADPAGSIGLGGSVFLARTGDDPTIAASFAMTGGALSLAGMISATDAVTLTGDSITAGAGTMFLDTARLTLTARGALRLDPGVVMGNIGVAVLTAGSAALGGDVVRLPDFAGGALTIDAPVGIALGALTLVDGATLTTRGTLTLGGGIAAGGALAAAAGRIEFTPGGAIRDAGSVTLAATGAIVGGGATVLKSRGAVTITTPSGLTLGAFQAKGGSIVTGGDLTLTGGFASTGPAFSIRSAGGVGFAGPLTLAGGLDVTAGGAIGLGNMVQMTGSGPGAVLALAAGTALTIGRQASITATGSGAQVQATAGSVQMDTLASITGAAVSVLSRGAATLGDIKAGANQTVSVRSAGALAVGQITGGALSLVSTGGTLSVRGAVKAGAVTIQARDDVATAGLAATSASIASTLGAVSLGGTTRIQRPDQPTGATLMVAAGKGIAIGGATSATGGMAFTGTAVATTSSGYLTDADLPGAPTTLRADTIDVRFATGTMAGNTALRLDARGRSGGNVDLATFRFDTLRPVSFDALWVNRGTLTTATSLTVASLTMRDWLVVGGGGATIALQGATTPPAAVRTVRTGSLTGARLVTTPTGGTPAVAVDGTQR